MTHILTLVVDRTVTTLSDAIIARVRDAIQGAAPVILSPGEAADIPCKTIPSTATLADALGEAADRRYGQHHRHLRDPG
jgi:phosphoserine phosphatase